MILKNVTNGGIVEVDDDLAEKLKGNGVWEEVKAEKPKRTRSTKPEDSEEE